MNILLIEKDGTLKGAVVGGYRGTFEEIKELKEVDGRVAYEVTTLQFEKVRLDYDVSIVNGKVKLVKGQNALEYEQKQKDIYNNIIYEDIGKLLLIKISKESSGQDVVQENEKIEKLKSQLE